MIEKGGFVTCRIDVKDADSASSQLRPVGKITCEDIIIAIEGDGYAVINAKNSSFVGETGFEFTVTDGFNVSNTAYITLKVVEDCLAVERINGKLKDNFSVLYTYDPDGDNTTGTTESAYEVVIDKNGVITSVGGYNSTVPEGGYVVSASGTKQQYLKDHCAVGAKATVDAVTGHIAFEKVVSDESSDDVTSEPEQTDGGNNSTVLIIVIAVIALAVITAAVLLISKKRKK